MLGEKLKDKVSGFTGVAVSEHNYLNGCARYTIQPPVDADGKLPECETFDSFQLEKVEDSKPVVGNNDTGGPDKYMPKSRPGE